MSKREVFTALPQKSRCNAKFWKGSRTARATTDKSTFYEISPNCSKNLCLNKCLVFFIRYYLRINVDFEGFSVQRCLEKWILCNDIVKSFETLFRDPSKALACFSNKLLIAKLQADGFNSTSLKLWSLAIEMFKVNKELAWDIFASIFKTRNKMNTTGAFFSNFSIPSINSVYNGTEIISFLGLKVWDIIPSKIKRKII